MASNNYWDWKYTAGITLTVVGIAISIIIWRYGNFDKKLSTVLITQEHLAEYSGKGINGIQISIDGITLEKPYLSIIQIKNSGDIPISKNDFEKPIEISLNANASISKVNVFNIQPQEMPIDIAHTPNTISIMPMLLNPNDELSLSIVTSGAEPTFKIQSRIAGIQSIKIDGNTANKTSKLVTTIQLVIILVSFFAATGIFLLALDKNAALAITNYRLQVYTCVVLTIATGCYTTMQTLTSLGVFNFWTYTSIYMSVAIASSILNLFIVKPTLRRISSTPKTNNKPPDYYIGK